MATELADGCWRIEGTGVNAFLVTDGDDLVLVDAGTPWDAGAVRSGVADAGYDPTDVDRVLVTHFDLDHVGGLAKLDRLDATVHAPDPDASFLTGERKPPLSNHKGLMHRGLGLLVGKPTQPVERVADGDELGSFTAYHTPGHTPGHTAYVSDELDLALLGDLVMTRRGALQLPPRILNYDTKESRGSLRSFADRSPPFDLAATGHGDPIRVAGDEALARAARP